MLLWANEISLQPQRLQHTHSQSQLHPWACLLCTRNHVPTIPTAKPPLHLKPPLLPFLSSLLPPMHSGLTLRCTICSLEPPLRHLCTCSLKPLACHLCTHILKSALHFHCSHSLRPLLHILCTCTLQSPQLHLRRPCGDILRLTFQKDLEQYLNFSYILFVNVHTVYCFFCMIVFLYTNQWECNVDTWLTQMSQLHL